MKRIVFTIAFCLLMSMSAWGQDGIELTLQQAIDTSLKQNLTIREQKFLVDEANSGIQANRGEFDPALKLEYHRTYSRAATFTPLMSPEEKTSGYSASVGGKAPTGTSYELKYASQRVEQSEDTLFLVQNPYYTTDLTLTLRQPLLKGLGPGVQTAQVASARKAYDAARHAASAQAADVIVKTSEAYWDLYLAQKNLDVAERSLKLAKSLLEEVKNKIQAGAFPQVELFNAEAETALREERLLQAQMSVKDAEDVLRAQMDSEEWGRALVPVTEPSYPFDEPSFEDAMAGAMENRWDYLQAQSDLESKEILERFYRNQKLPSLDLVAGAGVSGLGGDASSSYNQAEEGDYYSWQVGLELTVPIGNRSARGNYNRSHSETEASRLRVEQVKKAMALEIREALRALELARQSIEATGRTKAAMEKRLDAARERFRLGMATLNDVLTFEKEYAEASSNVVRAITDYEKAHTHLERAYGALLAGSFQ